MADKKRLFIGTFLKTDKLLKEYPKLKKNFENAVFGKWVEDWNLHFTYHFLGEIEADLVETLHFQLSPFLIEYESEISLLGLGCFPSLRSPKVLFVNLVDKNEILKGIHQNCGKVLSNFNIELEKRDYHPHLTLLRIKSFERNLFQKTLEKYSNFDFGKVEKFKVELIESKLTKEGPIYKVVQFLP
ncbi:MAG: RNA 2',3'-cyclic phosphodiesterase [Ignavibacteria bacterium]|nr:RNA 2',3'-cyclic phosphodiesterase [Ignavibacteria bacterium]